MEYDYIDHICVYGSNPMHQLVYEFDEPFPYRSDLLK